MNTYPQKAYNSGIYAGNYFVLFAAFFSSGYAALSYQVCWQRLLFAAIGVDIESVTIIVSVFMLGLGMGALLGGHLADRAPGRIILFFALAELGIGLFGLASPMLIRTLSDMLVEAPRLSVAVTVYAFLALPTLLMGATLPMLVAYVNQRLRNVGVSIGWLYFTNTMGAALGASATGFLMFLYLDIHQTIYFAAIINILACLLIYLALGDKK